MPRRASAGPGQATDYFGVTHPSEPSYIAATSGSNWDVNNDNGRYPTSSNPAVNHYNHTNIVDLLEQRHISWAAYMEAMPHAGYLGDVWPSSADPLYASKHDPFILYNDVRNNPARRSQIKPYSALARDLNAPNSPGYVWISPDQCNDLHGGVYDAIKGHPETPCPYKTRNSVIFVTADETDFDASKPQKQLLPIDGWMLRLAGAAGRRPSGEPEVAGWRLRRRQGADDRHLERRTPHQGQPADEPLLDAAHH